jgi:hypothetical protein
MGRAAPGRVFNSLRDLIPSDRHPPGRQSRSKVSRLYVVVRPSLTTILPAHPMEGGPPPGLLSGEVLNEV